MTKNIFKTALVALGAGTMLTGCDLEQPEAACFVQDAPSWAVKYEQVDPPRRVVGGTVTNEACTAVAPVAERIGVYKFVNPDQGNAATLALRPEGLTLLATADTNTQPKDQTAIGSFASEPDADDFCAAPTFPAARVNTSTAGQQIVYQFANVRVYAAPNAPGTQLTGELTYTVGSEADYCRSTYVMSALWPAVPCVEGSEDSSETCGDGSGLNPDFDAACAVIDEEHQSGWCVPRKAVPSFNEDVET